MTEHVGVIEEYDGVVGVINENSIEYYFTYTSPINKISVGDTVRFFVADKNYNIATDIERYEKKDLNDVLDNIDYNYKSQLEAYYSESIRDFDMYYNDDRNGIFKLK
ncbi:MAG: hypothetical protein IKR57_01345 [Bacilli bacterium]|nr:hypothetical protein [Bacilli bacterium]